MLTLLSTMILRSINDRSEFPDHLKENADRYVRSPRAQRRDGISKQALLPFQNLW